MIPSHVVQHRGRPAHAAAAAAAPGHRQPVGPGRPGAAVPDGADRPGGQPASGTSTSPRRCCDVYRLWRPTPLFRARRLEQALGTPAQIYYKYEGGSPVRLAQAEHRRAAGLLQRARGRPAADHRDRRGPVGHGAGLRLRAVRPGVQVWMVRASYDQKPYRRALMRDVRRDRARQPVAGDRRRAARSWPSTPTRRAAWASRSARRSRWPARTPTPTTRSAAC